MRSAVSLRSTRPVRTLFAAAALALPLAACNSGPEVSATNATQAEVQEKVAAAGGTGVMIQPGRWEGQLTMHEIDMPGLPAEAKEQMKARMGAAQGFVSCVTEEDVKEQKAFFTGDERDKSCKYDRFTLGGGKLDAQMNCDRGPEGKMAISMAGTYSADAYHMEMSSKTQGAGPMGAMNMKMSVDAKRVGVCKGTADES